MIRPTITRNDVVRQHSILDSVEAAIGHLLQALNKSEAPGETPEMVEWQTNIVGLIVSALNEIEPEWEESR